MPVTRSKTPQASDEEARRAARRERNRQSAADSRSRKKEAADEMAAQMEALRAENGELRRLLAAAEEAAKAPAPPAAAALPNALPRVQGRRDKADENSAKRARKALDGEELRQTIRDEIPPTGLALAQLGCDQFATEITTVGTQMQEVVARDGPMRRLRVGIFRDGQPIRGSDVHASGLQIHAELHAVAGHAIPVEKWLNRHDAEHNPTGKMVFNTALLHNHEVAMPISIKALSSDKTLFPGASKTNHVPLKLVIRVKAAAHGGATFGVAEATTRPFLSKVKTNLARKRIEGAPRAAAAPGAFGLFTGTADLSSAAPAAAAPAAAPAAPAAVAPAAPAPATLAPSRYSSEDLDAIIDDALANPAPFI